MPDPLYQRFQADPAQLPQRTIVGVVGETQANRGRPMFYIPQSQENDRSGPCEMDVVIRLVSHPTKADRVTLERAVRDELFRLQGHAEYKMIWNIEGQSRD